MHAFIIDSPVDIGIVLLVVVILFGAKKIPELMHGLGTGIRGFKEGMKGEPAPNPPVPTSTPPATAVPPSAPEQK
ncbi:MAG: twin-arginine translocase TatA/TatE family subunit [Candidatus Acidiferrales bacterium]